MMPQNAFCPLIVEPAGVFPAPGRGMANAAEAYFKNPALTGGSPHSGAL